MPKIIDNLLGDNFMLYRYISMGKKWAGETLKFPVALTKNNQGKAFAGLDYLNTGTVESRQTLSYDPRGYSIPVAVPDLESAVNEQDETRVISLIKAEMDWAYMSMCDTLGDMFYGDGTGSTSKEFNGLANLVDDGTTAATVGGLSRTTFPTLSGTRTSFAGVLTMAKLATLNSAVSAGAARTQRPSVIVASESEQNLYETMLSPTVRANYETNGLPTVTRTSKRPVASGDLKGTGGFTSFIYRGIPWVADEKSPAGSVWMLNESYLMWFGLKYSKYQQISLGDTTEGPYSDQPTDNVGFQWRPFLAPTDQAAEVAQIFLMGNLVTNQPRRHGRGTSVTGV